jgi:hypothetical protein
VFDSSGLAAICAVGSTSGKPLLDILDSIKDSRESSPLFRAYLFLSLMNLMRLQPDAWGINYSPSALADEQQIKNITHGQLSSGDWFVSSKMNAYSDKLGAFFASAQKVSYAKQARGIIALAQAVAVDNLHYVGFVGLDGKPNYVEGATGGEVWGYGVLKQPVLLAQKVGSDQSLMAPAMPLSPLFALPPSVTEYLGKAAVDPNDASFANELPALFQTSRRR